MASRTTHLHSILIMALLATGLSSCMALVDKPAGGSGEAFRPQRLDATPERIAQIHVPDGFELNVFARDLGEPRMIEVAGDGTVYITLRKQGQVVALNDRDGDGVAEEKRIVVRGLDNVHGIAIHEQTMYLAAPEKLWTAPVNSDGTVGEPRLIIDDLPEAGRHGNRTLAFSPEGEFFISVGSSSNAEPEKNPEHATILRASPDGKARQVFARGLRNTIGFDWHPKTGAMWGMDHGSDWRGDDLPPEELNLLQEGKDYGWPFVYGKRVPDRITPGDPPHGMSLEDYARQTEPMVLGYTAHAAPLQMQFYDAEQFPAEYRGDAFVAMRGSWNRKPAAGYEVVRIKFDDAGQPQSIEPFATGWLLDDGQAHIGRLAGLAVAKDGSLLVGDDTNAVIYRIAYTGKQ